MEKKQKKFYLPPEVAKGIEEKAKATGVSESHYASEAIKEKLKRDKRK
jgi:predicted ribonuclease toxin of YeeF-YezG toxin-antitoxin module